MPGSKHGVVSADWKLAYFQLALTA